MITRDDKWNHSISGVFVFLILGIFAVFSVIMILFGAQAYKTTVTKTAYHNTKRILESYVRNMLRNSDSYGGVSFGHFSGTTEVWDEDGNSAETDYSVDVLIISDPSDEGEYVKYVYVYDNKLCELYTSTEYDFDPSSGEAIVEADSITVTCKDSILSVSITLNDMVYVTDVALRCGG